MAKSFQIFLFYYDIPRDPIFIQQYYLVSINPDMNLQREVNNEPHRLTFPNDCQDSDSEGSSNYTLAQTHPVMPPPPDKNFQTREELINSAKLHAAKHGYALVIRTSRPGKLWLKCDTFIMVCGIMIFLCGKIFFVCGNSSSLNIIHTF